jgi:hypothetical protein
VEEVKAGYNVPSDLHTNTVREVDEEAKAAEEAIEM